VPGMIGNPIFELEHGGNPPTGPELSPKAIGFGPPLQELGQAGELLGRKPARGPGGWTVAQGIGAFLAGALHPLTDGAFADAERFGDLVLGPTLLLEAPGLESSGFFPVGRCRVHAWEYTTKSLGL
jgi:hypothetical protein